MRIAWARSTASAERPGSRPEGSGRGPVPACWFGGRPGPAGSPATRSPAYGPAPPALAGTTRSSCAGGAWRVTGSQDADRADRLKAGHLIDRGHQTRSSAGCGSRTRANPPAHPAVRCRRSKATAWTCSARRSAPVAAISGHRSSSEPLAARTSHAWSAINCCGTAAKPCGSRRIRARRRGVHASEAAPRLRAASRAARSSTRARSTGPPFNHWTRLFRAANRAAQQGERHAGSVADEPPGRSWPEGSRST